MTLGPLQPPTPSCILYIDVLGSHCLHYNNYDGDIYACVLKACISSKYSKCISAIKRILYTTAMYISSSSFVHLCISLCCDACLKSSALRVGVKTLHNTIISIVQISQVRAYRLIFGTGLRYCVVGWPLTGDEPLQQTCLPSIV